MTARPVRWTAMAARECSPGAVSQRVAAARHSPFVREKALFDALAPLTSTPSPAAVSSSLTSPNARRNSSIVSGDTSSSKAMATSTSEQGTASRRP